jgi:sulfotransferase 6B1
VSQGVGKGIWERLYSSQPAARRASRWMRQVPRAVARLSLRTEAFFDTPPIVANSIPKSGTHLLTQVLAPLASHEYGTFWTSVPSRPYRELPRSAMIRALRRTVPGELASAHLFHDPGFHAELERRNAVQVFLFRDPRDVVVSEADYLTRVNTWHGLHRHFKGLATDAERISLAILGDPAAGYPDVGQRFRRYLGWLRQDGVLSVRFEDLVGDDRPTTVREIVRFHARHATATTDEDELVAAALAAVDPTRSFTFRRGRAGGWRDVLTEQHVEQVKRVAGDLLVELGYESDHAW